MVNASIIDWPRLAARYPLLAAIPAGLRSRARIRPVGKDQILFHRGDKPSAVLCVLAGEIRLLRRTPQGSDVVLQRSRGGFVAEASLDAPVYHCDVVAACPSEVLLFPLVEFHALIRHDPVLNDAWISQLMQEVRRQRACNERLSLNGAAERILHYLEAEGVDGAVTLTQTRKEWAAELGLSHETVYRTLRQLRQSGLVNVEGATITAQTGRRR